MKKLMNKKMNLFGKEFSVFVVTAVAMMALASAALVPYLSNTISATVSVDSPIYLQVATTNAGTWGDSVDLGTAYGGSVVTYFMQEKVQNDALSGMTTYLVTNISENSGIGTTHSCDEITEVSVNSGAYTLSNHDLECQMTGDIIQIIMPSTNMGQGTNVYQIDVTFAVNAIGHYSANAQHMKEHP